MTDAILGVWPVLKQGSNEKSTERNELILLGWWAREID